MATPVTPIKRSKELAPLSREHHEGLLFVFKIKQGLKLGVAIERMVRFCTWNRTRHFAPHFRKEETGLVPVLGEAHPMIKRMLEEHKTINNLFADVKHYPATAALESLAQTLNDHIRFEERQLFPLIEQTATPDQMALLAQALTPEPPACEAWTDEFWVAPKQRS